MVENKISAADDELLANLADVSTSDIARMLRGIGFSNKNLSPMRFVDRRQKSKASKSSRKRNRKRNK